MPILWVCKSFIELTAPECYAILQLRNQVFVVEQQCIFQDADNKDQGSHHSMGWDGDILAAYARLVPAGIAYPEISIGRVAINSQFRNGGLGRQLMIRSIDMIHTVFGDQSITIGAQLYLQKFYESLGFEKISDIYIEDGIQHIEMMLK